MKKLLAICLIITSAQAIGSAALDGAYSEGLKVSQDNMQKSVEGVLTFNPSDAFMDENGKTYFTENPPQISHYQKIEQGNKDILEDTGRNNIDKNEAIEAIWKSFGNPKIKLDPEGSWFNQSKEIIKNSAAIVTGNSSAVGINCQESKICRIENINKMCNEEIKPLKKICEKIPKISTKKVFYPNCQSLIITQHYNTRCPSGYGKALYADMVYTRHDHWDDIRFCTRALSAGEGPECFSGGYYITSKRGNKDSGRVTVPKKSHAYIRMSNVYFEYIIGTVINETTRQTLYSEAHFSNGQIINLPYSDAQNQTFRFYATQPPKTDIFGSSFFIDDKPGIMVLYVDHMYKEANLESWTEVNCYES
jgi:hypothetical protein